MIIVANNELMANTVREKKWLVLPRSSITKSIPNKKNWMIITDQCIILQKRDFLLISLLTWWAYSKRINEPIPYPIDTVSMNIRVSEVLLYGKSWRVMSKSIITRKMMDIPIAIGIFLLFIVNIDDLSSKIILGYYRNRLYYVFHYFI